MLLKFKLNFWNYFGFFFLSTLKRIPTFSLKKCIICTSNLIRQIQTDFVPFKKL